ncbi:MAG TPA: DUF6384 family protein [Gammaproteobacteria bacterium]|nr:DUF6384 family protein [Gammaproteobacteria bacterium]
MNEVVVKEPAPLDELMLAMDVVDTLRHKELMLAREVEADDREQRLLARLREIYTAQGIEVSDDVLKQGVAALQEERFVYKGPTPSFSRSLAMLYVTRGRWGKWVTAAVAIAVVGAAAFQFAIRGPQLRAEAQLPGELKAAYQTVMAETQDPAAVTEAQRLLDDGKVQLAHRDLGMAGAAVGALRALDARLNEQYELKVVQRRGERSGVWRVPENNPRARNYYLIVEAVTPGGERLTLPIRNEESGSTAPVREWGLRVDEATFNRVAADQRDDGIIEQDVVGAKRRGMLNPEYSVATTGAAITKW